jgi:hypothetical protein
MTLESSTSDQTLNLARSKDALRDNPELDILTLVLDITPSNRTRESLLGDLMALKAMRDEDSQRGDSQALSMKPWSVGNSELPCGNINDAVSHAKQRPNEF